MPKQTDFICSEHFEKYCLRVYSSQVRLKEDAIPTKFNFPAHLVKKVPVRRPLFRNIPSAFVSPENSTSIPNTCTSTELETARLLTQTIHNYALMQSPRAMERKSSQLVLKKERQRLLLAKKLKLARQRLYRQKARLQNMTDVIQHLKSDRDISSEAVALIEHCFGTIPAAMLRRKLRCSTKDAYNDEICSFASTLHFYSPKAYDFVRRSFANTLPHPSTLRRWSSAMDGKPGFTKVAFEVGIFTVFFTCV